MKITNIPRTLLKALLVSLVANGIVMASVAPAPQHLYFNIQSLDHTLAANADYNKAVATLESDGYNHGTLANFFRRISIYVFSSNVSWRYPNGSLNLATSDVVQLAQNRVPIYDPACRRVDCPIIGYKTVPNAPSSSGGYSSGGGNRQSSNAAAAAAFGSALINLGKMNREREAAAEREQAALQHEMERQQREQAKAEAEHREYMAKLQQQAQEEKKRLEEEETRWNQQALTDMRQGSHPSSTNSGGDPTLAGNQGSPAKDGNNPFDTPATGSADKNNPFGQSTVAGSQSTSSSQNATSNAKDPDQNYDGQPCDYFTKSSGNGKLNRYADDSSVCYGKTLYACVNGRWNTLGPCNHYQNPRRAEEAEKSNLDEVKVNDGYWGD